MKNRINVQKVRFFGIIAFVAIIGFSMAACGDNSSGDNSSPGHTHIFSVWVRTVNPSCTTAGEEKSVCDLDATHIGTRFLYPLGHLFSGWSTTGNVTKACQRAGCSGMYSINEEMVQIPAGTFTMGPDIWNNNEMFSV